MHLWNEMQSSQASILLLSKTENEITVVYYGDGGSEDVASPPKLHRRPSLEALPQNNTPLKSIVAHNTNLLFSETNTI
jgi:hypothetical protein